MKLNGLMEETPPLVSMEELDWTAVTEEQIRQMEADVVIAAGLIDDISLYCRTDETVKKTQ